jgi:hypothetical protein
VIGEPPLLAGALKYTTAEPEKPVIEVMVGAPGAVAVIAKERVTVGAAR